MEKNIKKDKIYTLLSLYALIIIAWILFLIALYFSSLAIIPLFSDKKPSLIISILQLFIGVSIITLWLITWKELAKIWMFKILPKRSD
jgi:hypothetical protein